MTHGNLGCSFNKHKEKMKRVTALLATLAATAALTGCFIPEKFTASVKMTSDGSYSYRYDGLTAFVPAILEMKKTGTAPPAKIEQDLQAQADKLGKSPDVQKSVYAGNGRYEFVISGERKPGQAASVLDAFRVFTDKDGYINITSVGLKPADKAELQKLGLKINGKLEVTLPRNAEVISSNATSTPSLFGLFGTYSWKIGSIEERPMMKIRLR